MSHSLLDEPEDLGALQYIVTHVFFPLQLPSADDRSIRNDCSLTKAVASALRRYTDRAAQANKRQWHSILSRMLDNLQAIVQFESLDRSQTVSQLRSMNVGGKLLSFRAVLRLTVCRCPRIPYPSPKRGDLIQKAGRCYHFRVVRGIPEG